MWLPVSAKVYIAAISVLTALVISSIFPGVALWQNPTVLLTLVVFALLLFLTEVYEVELVYHRAMSTGIAICLTALLLGGASLGTLVTLLGTLSAEMFLRWPKVRIGFGTYLTRVMFNTGQLVLAVYAAAWVFQSLGGEPLLFKDPVTLTGPFFMGSLLPALGAFTTMSLLNNFFVSGIITLTERTSFFYHLRFNLRHLLVQILSLGVLGILMAVVYAQSPWNLALVLIPLGLVHLSLRNYMRLREEAKKAFEKMADLLAKRDTYTYEHSKDVAELAVKIARKLKLPLDQVEKIRSAAMIHDIGKIAIPDSILQKPGPLSEEEWKVMKLHPVIGADLIKDLEIYADVADIVRYEHERWNGSGYPRGLQGDEIPLGARIVAAADIYNALTTDRPYRPAYSPREAQRIIKEMRGVELDPRVADALLAVLEEEQTEAEAGEKAKAKAKEKSPTSRSDSAAAAPEPSSPPSAPAQSRSQSQSKPQAPAHRSTDE